MTRLRVFWLLHMNTYSLVLSSMPFEETAFNLTGLLFVAEALFPLPLSLGSIP